MSRQHTLKDFDYRLPPELIAQVPAPTRTGSRLLHVDGAALADLVFADLPGLIAPDDLLVFNDTRVIKSRIEATKPTGGRVELLLERITGPTQALFQLRASHPPRIGDALDLPGGARAAVTRRRDRFFELRLESETPIREYLDRHGAVPLPPYIARPVAADDEVRYQTVYARHAGAVAAPTAGLHFDEAAAGRAGPCGDRVCVRHTARRRGYVPARANRGPLAPTRCTPSGTASQARQSTAIDAARARCGRIVAVGTTSLRALESAATADGRIRPGDAETQLFITPGYGFRVVDRLLTNFHLPRSTLLMLVSAFAGYDNVRAAYAHAIALRYRFFSYGDAMLLERSKPAADAKTRHP